MNCFATARRRTEADGQRSAGQQAMTQVLAA